jgi:thimet oligopeptidase
MMRGALLCGLMLGAISAGANPAFAVPQPVDAFLGGILADPQDSAAIAKRCDTIAAEIDRRIAELEGEKGPATAETTLRRFDDLMELINASSGEFGLYREVMADDARRAAGAACEVRMGEEANKIGLSRPIYDRLKAIDAGSANPATRLYLTRTLASFERSGVSLPPADRAKVRAMQDRLSQLGTAFDKGIADGAKSVEADPAELAGLPQDYIDAHKPGADGKITITTAYPDYQPVMAYARSEALRKRLYTAYMTRAYPANDAVLREILDTRQKLATAVGRKDWATLFLEDKMLDTPAKVEELLGEMAAAARPAGERDLARKLAVLKAIDPSATTVEPWNDAYAGGMVEKQAYAYDRQEVRKYFAYDNVRDGILKLTQDLFGVEIRPWQTAKWDPLVEPYEMYDHGKLIGRFYFDSHPRPGKYEHANAIPLRPGLDGRTVPTAALVMNLPAGGHATGLMEHRDVETFLHEYGHLLHEIFGGQEARWAGQAGTNTQQDFVEAPSQMLEEWVYDYDTLKTFAVNAQGQPIPADLVAKLNKARYFDLGMGDMRQLALSNISLKLHEAPAPANLGDRTRELYDVYGTVPLPDFTQMQDGFPHLNGYSAGYYTYRWSKVIADDMFTEFENHGMRNATTFARYRQLVLAPGGSRPAAQLVESFLGRPISLDAYKADLAKDK